MLVTPQTRPPVALGMKRPEVPGAEWYSSAGLGLFVHWDHASRHGIEISWPMVGHGDNLALLAQGYNQDAALFHPDAWDAERLAELAASAGFRYGVITTRHHAGYAMFQTESTGLGLRGSGFERDVTHEFVEAFRAAGLRVGLYYSLSDWSHPDYPAITVYDLPYRREHWPYAGRASAQGTPWAEERHRRSSPAAWERFRAYVRTQLVELLTNYGPIDVVWFDGQWERSPEEWRADEFRALIRELQPEAIVNDRLPGCGDFETPEQGLPDGVPTTAWEMCLTMGEQWAWKPGDTYKSARELVIALIEVAARGGNLLLNIGPRGDGSLEPEQVSRIEQIGAWMAAHGCSVQGVHPTAGIEFYGPSTACGDVLYLHLVMRPVDTFVVRGIPIDRVKSVSVLATGEELSFTVHRDVHAELRDLTLDHEPVGELRVVAPPPTGALVDVVTVTFQAPQAVCGG